MAFSVLLSLIKVVPVPFNPFPWIQFLWIRTLEIQEREKICVSGVQSSYYHLAYPKWPVHFCNALLFLLIFPLSETTSLFLHYAGLAGWLLLDLCNSTHKLSLLENLPWAPPPNSNLNWKLLSSVPWHYTILQFVDFPVSLCYYTLMNILKGEMTDRCG